MTEVHEALRRWAKGLYPLEAGVELLIGRFAHPGQPWVQQGEDPGWWWIDVEQMNEDNYAALSGGETGCSGLPHRCSTGHQSISAATSPASTVSTLNSS